MPTLIKILPQFIANRIAAGEVVGRPESVVKELIENSIDANAGAIWVIVKDAGKNLIQVIDDGVGMSEDDALVCFQRHSTSKISEAEDLENIKTLGFRGEALASICAVAQVEMKTKTDGSELGAYVKNHGSEVIESYPSAFTGPRESSHGTYVSVKNLFFNTPARRNFLKSNQTEFKHIYDTFIRLAIANPSISFKLINDDEEIFDFSKTGLQNRLIQIYGIEYVESLIEVKQDYELISLHGFISKPSFTKKSRQDQFLFLNKRYVVNKALSYAVHMAYEDLIEKGDYPNFFLFLKIDPQRFDVNVHPSKLEVKFEDEKAVFGFVRKSVWNTLKENDLVVSVGLKSEDGFQRPVFGQGADIVSSPGFEGKLKFVKERAYGSSAKIHELFKGGDPAPRQAGQSDASGDSLNKGMPPPVETNAAYSREGKDDYPGKNSIWQFQKKYIMYQLENTLMIIDQHAAHERILYEHAVERLESNANLSQQLLIPLYVELNPIDYEVAKSIEHELESLGFDIELLAKRKIKLKGIPSDVRLGDEGKILQDLIDEFKENDVKLNLDKRDNLAKSYACKHAIKAGDRLSEDEMLNLIDKLFLTRMPYVCPHGRPTIVKISMDELDRKFARTGF